MVKKIANQTFAAYFNGAPLRENFILLFKKLTADAEFENAFVHNFETLWEPLDKKIIL